MQIILGIHDGHHSNACLFINDKLICAIAEERITRNKSEYGYPKNAINYCLNAAKIKKENINIVALSTIHLPPKYALVKRATTFSVNDYFREQKEYWYPKFYKNENPAYLDIFKDKTKDINSPYDYSFVKDEDDTKGMLKSRIELIKKELNINLDQIKVFDHHSCHAYYGYFWYHDHNRDFLVIAVDGAGDGANGSIWIANKEKPLVNLVKTDQCNIGRIYRYTTLILGMKPNEHEFKVMGLAPYAKELYANDSYEIFSSTLSLSGLNFYYKKKIKDHFWYYKNKFDSHRFDNIAFGLQKFTEKLLVSWVKSAIEETKINNIVLSGGVALNVKANKCISEIKLLNDLFVPPGPNDESLSVGASFQYIVEENNKRKNFNIIKHINPYLGIEYKTEDILALLKNEINIIIRPVDYQNIANLLNLEKIVARFSGKMEFGPRALGNRSILADPREKKIISVINNMVKMRDFWMPFCPSIISECVNDYIINFKENKGSFMTMGYESTTLARKVIPAALHPADHTARPQVVNSYYNKGLYKIISKFKDVTNVGCLLNTSFNIHGEPIVESPKDAINTFKKTGLNHLVFNDSILLSKYEVDID